MNIKKINKKRLISTLGIAGLVISAPLATFAYMGNANNENRENLSENKSLMMNQCDTISDEDRMNLIKNSIELQIEHANVLIAELDENNEVDKERLLQIVNEYGELEEFLDNVDVSQITAEELREAFFDVQSDSRELSREFRELIQGAFSPEERQSFRDEFRVQMNTFKSEYGIENNPRTNLNKNWDMRAQISSMNRDQTGLGMGKGNSEMRQNSETRTYDGQGQNQGKALKGSN